MLSNEEVYSKIKLNLSKMEEVSQPSSFDGVPLFSFVGKADSYLTLLKENQANLLNKTCNKKDVEDLVLNCLSFKQTLLKSINKRLLQTEIRKDSFSQMFDIVIKMEKLPNQKEYHELFEKYRVALDLFLVSEPLTTIESSKVKGILQELKEKFDSIEVDHSDDQFKDIYSNLGLLINQFSSDCLFLKSKIEDLPILIDEGDSSILVALRELQKNI